VCACHGDADAEAFAPTTRPMPIRFFNTRSRAVETFTPIDPPGATVSLYTCGPTVYAHAHIGNFRAYTFEDLLQRHLEWRGYVVRRVMNLTDVDDKTIRGCRAEGIPLAQFTARFKTAFFEDLEAMRIRPAEAYPAATDPENIGQMIAMIARLLESGHAYQADDRSVYFRLSAFPDYGKLAHLDLAELRPGGRVRSDEYEKESIGDFALWKAWDEEDGEVAWESPWGRGRPGWHIECSAMATRLLGDEIDIHCGGVDNIFPHHEAEIAQSECCTGKRFVRYWLHCAHLLAEGQKMSKSLGNFFTLRDLLARGFTGRELRYALLSVHYRLPLNFRIVSLEGARSALGRIDEWLARLTDHAGTAPAEPHPAAGSDAFGEALDDDLNISAALAVLFDAIRDSHRALDAQTLTAGQARSLLDWWAGIDTVLALSPEVGGIPAAVQALADERAAARAAKNWAESDRLRDAVRGMGWEIKDTRGGPAKLSPVKGAA